MANYKYAKYLAQEHGAEFDAVHGAATPTPFSGIYRCEGCSQSITSVLPHPLPPQNHHQHASGQGSIRWRLVVKSHFR